MSKDLLIEMWMANGFIPSQEDVSLYVLGEEIYSCLVRMSFFQDVIEKDIDTGEICKMHDLARYEMKHDRAVIESGKESIILDEVLHLSLSCEGKDDGARIGELGNLRLLGWKLILSRLKNVGGLRDAKSANLKHKTNLKFLQLWWSSNRRSETCDLEEFVEGLEPNSGLLVLKIGNYMGRVLSPSWLVKLVKLTSMTLSLFFKCEQLPPLGKLPSLKRIYLHDEDDAASKDEILFPNLQELDISSCKALVSLPSNFPKLKSLKIDKCDKLRSLPDEIQSFKDLNQIIIWGCKILRRRCEKEIGEDWSKISHIPHIDIRTSR
ncbi:disease resistance protein [Tanacetum coccineum]